MSDALLSIGTFSRASSLSVKTLRAYHAQGLLVPAAIDPETGFRRYAAGQLADAAIIRRLRGLEVPLADIATIVAARDPEVTASTLAGHAARMRERAQRVEQIVQDLHSAPPASWTPPRLTDIPAMTAVGVTGTVIDGDYTGFLEPAYARLEEACRSERIDVAGPASALYDAEFIDEAEQEVTAYFPVLTGVAPAGTILLHLPPVTAAVITHIGDLSTLEETYDLLGAWVAHHGTPTGQPVREIYVAHDSDGAPPSAHQTDLVWPLTPRKESR
ncbi:DNA-binding transcriptional MerR regulator [Nocardioides luteus]|uniref:HTH merR-type domain-containing protein n=1 Tax=Nocardioides luteus TaxID=1844 RepID=A0ABQ5SSD7_9ACTN|nr:MerR family transcriptional regulator [Nocardioides luteus]MDR7311329.1 DNA-binding transcriptional MerR regulator [Nocardioides luteus]GGR71034.1 hypothetical protein GCM10010197_43120 [Nocardioides luteus]GLJ66834.1 hypothetical protein GCM10017579_08700 [Nocardioides luteus]